MRHQRVFAATPLHNCIKYDNIHKSTEIKEEEKCLEATSEVAVTAPVCTMRHGDGKFEIGKFFQVDVDIDKERRKKYNSDYYKRRKEKNKLGKVDKGEVSEVDVDIEKGRRKEYNREYYARKKKDKMIKVVNGEGNSPLMTLPTNITASEMAQLERLHDRRIHFYSICANNEDMRKLSESQATKPSDTIDLDTEKTRASVDEVAQRRKICNRNYYQRSKEKKKMKTSVDKQGGTTTTKTIEVLNVTGKERIAKIMFEVGT